MTSGKSLWVILLPVIVLAVLLAAIRSADETDKSDKGVPVDSVRLNVAAGCEIAKGCIVSAQGVSAVVLFMAPIRYLHPFPVMVNTRGMGGMQVTSVTMEFSMRGMEMPVRPIMLTSPGTTHEWTGEGILPVCASGRRDWVGHLTINADRNSYKTDIVFEVPN